MGHFSLVCVVNLLLLPLAALGGARGAGIQWLERAGLNVLDVPATKFALFTVSDLAFTCILTFTDVADDSGPLGTYLPLGLLLWAFGMLRNEVSCFLTGGAPCFVKEPVVVLVTTRRPPPPTCGPHAAGAAAEPCVVRGAHRGR